MAVGDYLSMSSVGEATLVGFMILNFINFVTILSLIIYAVTDVYRRCKRPSTNGYSGCTTNVVSSTLQEANLVTTEKDKPVQFVRGLVPRKMMEKYRSDLSPKNVGEYILPSEKETDKLKSDYKKGKKVGLLTALSNGHDSNKRIIGPRDLISRDDVKDKSYVFKRLSKDPLVYYSSATSKYVRKFSPFRAKKFMTSTQLGSKLVYPHPIRYGTAFVLPTGYVINKAYGMDNEDLHTWNPPSSSVLVPDSNNDRLTVECAKTDPTHRIGIYGFGGSDDNRRAKEEGYVEMLLCNCDNHKDLLKAPLITEYSTNPTEIQVDVAAKRVLFPAPGSEPVKSSQVTSAAHQLDGATGEHDISHEPVKLSDTGDYAVESPIVFKPVYGTSLVNLPETGSPLALNCPCTDKADGIYQVNQKGGILYRDMVGYLNANPVEAASLSSSDSSSWLTTGNKISSVTCEGEKIKKIV
nr:wsv325-like protein [White spot syndrome virus]